MRTLGRMRGRAPVRSEPAGKRPPAAYFPARESRQSSPWGNRRGRALSGPNAPVSPWYPLSEYVRRRCNSSATVPESSCLPVRLFRIVTPLPVQRYPPRLETSCGSRTFLNAAQSLCVLFQPVVEQLVCLKLSMFPNTTRRTGGLPVRRVCFSCLVKTESKL